MEKSYIKGIIGSILGGMIASLPWIIVAVYADMLYSILAVLIAMGALKGYQLLNGKVDKKLPIIISVVSILCVTISTLVIIPMLIMVQQGFGASLDNLLFLYSSTEFFESMMSNYVISLLFTILGMRGVIRHINRELDNSNGKEIKAVELGTGTKNAKNKVKEYFLSNHAIDAKSAIEIDENANLSEAALVALIHSAVVIKKGNKYYYSEANEAINAKEEKKNFIVYLLILALFIGGIAFATYSKLNDYDTDYRSPKNVSFEISNNYIEEEDLEEEFGWYYTHKDHRFSRTGFISVYYYESDLTLDEETIKYEKKEWESHYDVNKVTVSEPFKTSNNYDSIEFALHCDGYISYLYYIVGDKYLAIVEVNDDNKVEGILDDGKKLVDTFKWTK